MGAVGTPGGTPGGGTEQDRYRRWGILAALCLSVFILAVDNTIINVALPTLADEFDASAGALKWFVEAYILAFAGLLLTGDTLGDRYGFRRALLVGLAVFGAAPLLAAFAGSGAALIAGRALMGVDAALILPATLAIIKRVFPEAERAKAIAVWSATATVGAAAGPVVGGALLETFWWGAVFLVNLPVVALTVLAAWRLVPAGERSRRVPLDLPGAALSLVGVGGLFYAIIAAPGWGWTSPAFVATVAGAGLALALLVRRELRARHPMLNLTLFKNPRFSGASQAIILVYFAFAGVAFALPQYLQYVLGHGPLVAGLLTAPVMVAGLAGGFAGAYLIRRAGTRRTLAGGLGGAAACAAALANLDIVEDEDLVARVADFEPEWTESVSTLAEHPLVEEVRAVGLLGALEISHVELEYRPGLLEEVVANARAEGILTRSLPSAIHLSPAFVITKEQVKALVAGLSSALDAVQEENAGTTRVVPERAGDDRLD